MVSAKVIRINGSCASEIEDVALLLQGCVDKVAPADFLRLLVAVNKNPGLVKKALKFL
ncbi:hypothetical protein FACS189464_1790 [Bacteroidia bacterium]|nr:hypothetical protein FACS189464_1790 [Bacteroidia bacterium]